jgi:hypothetical protein
MSGYNDTSPVNTGGFTAGGAMEAIDLDSGASVGGATGFLSGDPKRHDDLVRASNRIFHRKRS